MTDIRACSDCGIVQRDIDFPLYSHGSSRRRRCRECHLGREAANKRQRFQDKQEFRERVLKRSKRYRADPESGYREHRKRKGQRDKERYFSDIEHRCRQLVSSARRRAAKRNMPFNLDARTMVAVIQVQTGRCAVTGTPFQLGRSEEYSRSPLAPSIDRKDCSKGYTWDNVQIVVAWYNLLKNEWSDTDAKEFIRVAYQTLFPEGC